MIFRTFVALELPESQRQELQKYLAIWSKTSPANWVRPENLHITLLFIGDTEAGKIGELGDILRERAGELSPQQLTMLGFELFPSVNPRLLWVKLKGAGKDLFSFPGALAKDIIPLGLKPDMKPLKLHITMARIKQQFQAWQEREFLSSSLGSEPFTCNKITLYKSELRPAGPVYTALEHIELK